MKKTLVKALAMSAIAIALVVASVLGTMAYFTASSAVSNVFTVGNVGIQMFESKVNPDGLLLSMAAGTPITPATSYNSGMKTADTNSYKLVPGKTYIKDPTIYVNANSEKSYLFLKVRNDLLTIEAGYTAPTAEQAASFAASTMRAQLEANGWRFHHENPGTKVRVYVLCYTEAEATAANNAALKGTPKLVGGTAEQEAYDTFYTFTLATNSEEALNRFGGARVDLVAYAIQADGFADDDGYDYSKEFDDPAYTKVSAVDRAWDAIVDVYPYESGVGANS